MLEDKFRCEEIGAHEKQDNIRRTESLSNLLVPMVPSPKRADSLAKEQGQLNPKTLQVLSVLVRIRSKHAYGNQITLLNATF